MIAGTVLGVLIILWSVIWHFHSSPANYIDIA